VDGGRTDDKRHIPFKIEKMPDSTFRGPNGSNRSSSTGSFRVRITITTRTCFDPELMELIYNPASSAVLNGGNHVSQTVFPSAAKLIAHALKWKRAGAVIA
jgi:hypothetical protein